MPIIESRSRRWALALAIALVAWALNAGLQGLIHARAPLLPFFPVLVILGFLCGAGPALAALAGLVAVGIVRWALPSGYLNSLSQREDLIILAVFAVGSAATIAVASYARSLLLASARAREQLADALQASRSAERRFEWALRAAGLVGWECDTELRYTWVYNPLLGMKAQELLGRPLGQALPGRRFEGYAQAARRVLQTGEPEQVHVDFERDGELFQLVCRIEPVKDEAGHVVALAGATLDVTDTKRMESKLLLEARRKDEFLATLAHELRNPMAPIRYAVATLSAEAAAPAVKEHAVQVIRRQSGHMARLLDDLLDMSRISRGVIELEQDSVDLRHVVDQAVETVRGLMQERHHRLTLSLPSEPVTVRGDATRLVQALGNLLDNAAKYTPPGGEVELRLQVQAGHALLVVRDSGIGLAPEALPDVFDLFMQVRTPERGHFGGLGIGLSVVKRLVEMHGGSVGVASEGLGRGATFTLALPCARPEPAADAPSNVVPLSPSRCGVLVVDDNRDAADSLAMFLRASGYAVSVAYDGRSALQAFDALHPAVVVADIGLPDISGHELAERLRADARGARSVLVAVTGWGQDVDRERSRQAGFDVHLVKPVDPSEVEALLPRLLAERAA